MNEIKLNTDTDQPRVDSRQVAIGFEIEHRSLCITLLKNFNDLKCLNVNNDFGRPQKVYLLSERQISILPSMTKPTKKTIAFQTELVDAFFKLREQVKIATPKTYLEALKGMVILEEAKLKLEKQALIDAPKVDFFNTVKSTKSNKTIAEFSKLLPPGFGELKLFAILRDERVLITTPKNMRNKPYQCYLEREWFNVDPRHYENKKGEQKPYTVTMLTEKGQIGIVRLLNRHYSGQLMIEGK